MTDGFKIQVNVKIGDTLVNLRGDSPNEVESYLGWAEQNATTIHSTIQALQAQGAVAAAFPGSQNVQQPPAEQSWGNQPPPAQGPPQWSQPQQQAAPAQQQGPAPSCAHGPMTFRSGTKNGRDWKGYFCPTPKGTPNQCEPQFLKG